MDDTSRTRSLRSVRSSLARRAVAVCKGGREGSRLSGGCDLFIGESLVPCRERCGGTHNCALSALVAADWGGLGCVCLPAATSATSSSSSSSLVTGAACCCWRCLSFLAMAAPSASSSAVSSCLWVRCVGCVRGGGVRDNDLAGMKLRHRQRMRHPLAVCPSSTPCLSTSISCQTAGKLCTNSRARASNRSQAPLPNYCTSPTSSPSLPWLV